MMKVKKKTEQRNDYLQQCNYPGQYKLLAYASTNYWPMPVQTTGSCQYKLLTLASTNYWSMPVQTTGPFEYKLLAHASTN